MKIDIRNGLPFTSLTVGYASQSIDIPNILIDTGSASTILAADIVADIGILPYEDEVLYTIRGVGGSEVVFIRETNFIQIGNEILYQFEIEVGGMNYGFDINGILGMDFLIKSQAIINIHRQIITFEK